MARPDVNAEWEEHTPNVFKSLSLDVETGDVLVTWADGIPISQLTNKLINAAGLEGGANYKDSKEVVHIGELVELAREAPDAYRPRRNDPEDRVGFPRLGDDDRKAVEQLMVDYTM